MKVDNVTYAAYELAKGSWAAIRVMLDALSDEELSKLPNRENEPDAIKFAERFGICDILIRDDKYIHVYYISGYLFTGKTQIKENDDY